MSLDNLPDISFCDTDASAVEQSVLATYEAITETTLFPGDPVRLFLETLAYIIAQQRTIIDWSAKQNLLAYATGDYLDHLGALLNVSRLDASPAAATMEFTLAAPLAWDVIIPQGVRTTPGSDLYFATDEEVAIAAGEVSVSVSATCETMGTVGNGFAPGQINKQVDPVANVQAVANTTVSLGGSDSETDDHYRERIQLAPEMFSVAGPGGAYRYHAMSAHADMADVAAYSPEPGRVEVRPLLKGGELPSSALLALVEDVLNADTVVPLTDTVSVLAPEPVEYAINLTWFVDRANAANVSSIQTAVATAVENYRMWQRSALGRDINPTRLIAQVQQAGAKRVEVSSPAGHLALDVWQVAQETGVNVAYGGLEDA